MKKYKFLITGLIALAIVTAIMPTTSFAESSVAHQAATEIVKPITQAEIQQGLKDMQQRMNQQIEAWGKTLTSDDFEWSWPGRQLKKEKRQQVCGIYQNIINDIYRLAVENKARLSEQEQKLLQDRNAFIQVLGYQDNLVDSKMGFNCRIK
ncbi:hypothetical protein [Acinetobacter sp. ANC 3903]|uniref:hypothetical protein n=1 Tax=Acinetobacter sp. ANC 3903 TaxID=1977883 RepID=UPI001D171AD9|nr:hypothetical protein [Acinetobacter sp. ANC 3903]